MRRYLSEDHERWDGFEHRPGDIVVSTRSKCGTTLAQMMCALVVFQDPDLPAPLAEISPWLDWNVEPLEVVRQRLDSQQHRRIIKTHTPLDGLPLDPRVTYLVVGRHPLDVAVSLYHHGRNIDRDRVARLSGSRRSTDYSLPLSEWLRGWMEPAAAVEEQLDTLPGLVHHVSDAWRRSAAEENVTLLHYRNLVDDPRGQLLNLAVLLGTDIPEPGLEGLARAASFDAMKARAAWHAPDHLGVLKDPAAFFRAGRHGEGERVLNEQDLRRYEHRIRDLAEPEIGDWLHQGPLRTDSL